MRIRASFSVMPVSIHALLAECDLMLTVTDRVCKGFNPRTPCGVRPAWPLDSEASMTFQSTHSLRSATRFFDEQSAVGWRFNPRTPCGVRHFPVILIPQLARFQSTHSLRSATNRQLACLLPTGVSIHALLAECDLGMTRRRATMTCFNPRTPCGVRLVRRAIRSHKSRFQSTHSLRSATEEACLVELGLKVSIHALLAECDGR